MCSDHKKDDFKAIMKFKQLQKDCAGYVLYLGEKIIPFGNDCYVMPLKLFFYYYCIFYIDYLARNYRFNPTHIINLDTTGLAF